MMRRLILGAALAAGCHPAPPAPPQFLALNRAGELVEIEAALVPGKVNVVDFRADWCGGCAVIEADLHRQLTGNPRVVVRTVDVGDGDTPVARAYGIHGLPHVLIVDRTGALRYRLVGDDALGAATIARQVADER